MMRHLGCKCMIAFSLHMFTSIHCAPQKIRGHEWHVWAWAFGDHVIVWQSPGTGIQSHSSFAIRHSPFRLVANLLSSCWAEWKWNGQCACSGSRPIFSLTRQCIYIYVCMYYIAMYIRWIRMQMKSRQLWRGWANLWPNFQRWLSTGVQICGKNARWALAFGAVLSFKWN